jgi:hypothetical protein
VNSKRFECTLIACRSKLLKLDRTSAQTFASINPKNNEKTKYLMDSSIMKIYGHTNWMLWNMETRPWCNFLCWSYNAVYEFHDSHGSRRRQGSSWYLEMCPITLTTMSCAWEYLDWSACWPKQCVYMDQERLLPCRKQHYHSLNRFFF